MTRSNINWPIAQYTKLWDLTTSGAFFEIRNTKGKLWYLRQQLYKFRTFAIEQELPGAEAWAGRSLHISTEDGADAKNVFKDTLCILTPAPAGQDIFAQIDALPSPTPTPAPTPPLDTPDTKRSSEPSAQEDYINEWLKPTSPTNKTNT